MPIDPSIALGVRPPQFADPLQQYGNILAIQNAGNQNALSQYTLARAKREDETQNALAAAYRDAITPDGKIDYNRLTQSLAGGAAATSIPGVIKGRQEEEKRALDSRNILSQIGERDLNAGIKAMGQYRDALGEVTNPQIAAQWLQAQYNDPLVGPVVSRMRPFSAAISAIPSDPQGFQEWVQKSALGMEKFIEKNAPKINVQNLNDRSNIIATPGLGGIPQTLSSTPMGMSPAQASEAVNRPFLPSGAPNQPVQDFQMNKSRAGATRLNVDMKQEGAFAGELGKGQAKSLMDSKSAATDAKEIINTVNEGRRLLNSGMVTGFGAETLVGIGQALSQAGITFAEDATANSQAYAANMAQNVGKIIKLFGAGTGLSNADREYAEKMAGGKINLDKKAIEKILDINERMARNVITQHNKNASGIKTNIPLTVEAPPAETTLAPAEQSELDALRKQFGIKPK